MTDRMDGLIAEWAEDIVDNCHKSGFYGINVVERILRDPGKPSLTSKHRIHWWPRNKRIAMMSRAMHQIDPISQLCLVVKYGGVISEDGTKFTKYQLAKTSSIGLRKFNDLTRVAKNKLLHITKSYG